MIEKININDIVPKKVDDIDEFLGDYEHTPMTVHKKEPEEIEETTTREPMKEEMTLSGEVLTGTLFLTMIESFMPIIIGILNEKFDNKKVDIKKLKLTAGQKKELIPICDEVIKKMELTANPIYLLIGSVIGIYGINYMALRQQDDG